MAFTVAGLNEQLFADNKGYSSRSDLNRLVNILRGPQTWTAASITAEMKRISKAKWLKYQRTRQYLEREIAGLTALLRAIPTGFATVSMTGNPENTTLTHQFKWASDTGVLADLANVYVREHVRWVQWPPALIACIPANDATLQGYRIAGEHTGLKPNKGDVGGGTDNHQLQQPFGPALFRYNSAPASASMSQVYEYSYDQVVWTPIPDSSYTIVREVSNVLCNLRVTHVQVKLTKASTTRHADKCSIAKVF